MQENLNKYRAAHPWPVIPNSIKKFHWILDGGGKELITDFIKKNDIRLMVEVGVFMCGSVEIWAKSKHDLTVIAIDPWDFKAHQYFERSIDKYINGRHYNMYGASREEVYNQLARPDGFIHTALKNVLPYKDRIIPVVGRSPKELHVLKEYGVEPELIYLDSDKSLQEIDTIYELFPDIVICGDDWTWPDKDGNRPVEEFINNYCAKHNYHVEVDKVSWILHRD